MQLNQRAILDQLQGGNTGVNGGRQAPVLGGGGDIIPALSIYDTSNQTDAQRSAMQAATAQNRATSQAGFEADQAYLGQHGGQMGTRTPYTALADPSAAGFGGTLVGGSEFTGQGQGPAAATAAAARSGLPYTAPDPNADLSQGFGENHAGWAQAGSGAMTGMQVGKYLGGVGALPAAGVGAVAGWLNSRTNDTKDDREDFAKSLGVKDSTALWSKLQAETTPEAAQELQNRALNRIGKHDNTANAQWQQDVQAALAAGRPAPVAAAPTAAGGANATALVDALGGGAPAAGGKTFALEGFDQAKLAGGHDSPKYQVGRVLQQFDPKLGLNQPGLMEALNKLGIGQFSSTSDKLSVSGGDPRFNGMNTWDSIRDQEGDAGWQFGVDSNLDSGAGGGGQQGPVTGMPSAGVGMDPILSDPNVLAKIQAAIGQYAGQGQNIQALMAALGGGR